MARFLVFLRHAPAAAIGLAGLLLQLAATPLHAQQGPPPNARFGFVNLQVVIEQTPGYAAAESTLNAEIAGFRAEVQQLQVQLDSMIRAYDQQQIALSPTNRQAKEQEIRETQQRFQQRANELQTRIQQRERELIAPLEERVRGVIEGIRAERNLAFVFDVTNFITADRTLDLTALVVQRLRAGAQGGG